MARTLQILALLPPWEAKDPSQLQPLLLLPAWNLSGHSRAQASSAAVDCLANKALQETLPGEPHILGLDSLWNINHHTSLSCFAQTQPKKAAGGWDPCGVKWGQRWGLAEGEMRSCSSSSPKGQRAPILWHRDRARAPGGRSVEVLACKNSGQGVGAMPAPSSGSTNPPDTSAKSTWSPKES